MKTPLNITPSGNSGGFTLAELLIALAILGVIATFTIPKVLQAQQDNRNKAIAKEAVATISGAYQAYQLKNQPSASTKLLDLTPYMNYTKIDSSSGYLFDDTPGGTSAACGAGGFSDGTMTCLFLHNGAMIESPDGINFGGTGTTNAVYFYIDPDGKYGGSTSGPSKSIVMFLYFNGKIANWGNASSNTVVGNAGNSPYGPTPANDPSWFSWN
ncbi:MAG TPA: type II secretion system protein [Coleofasciculaceae cyanobacterium]|jgi:prepilin-type N-terminal cleavage/methylation domain-containing protein